ncbi:MAG: anti-anti-sigma factor [Solirubrobacterales bacterium]|jgi:anti-sigma B factor antagonist|nr:anti-anti-sigma factor [Solirubrobacterales bacterium]
MGELDGERGAEALISTQSDPAGVPIITVSGDLDLSNAGALEATVSSIAADQPAQLVFDLSALRFMDSAGIAVLLGAAAKVDAVHLRNPSPAVRRVVELTGLTDVLTIEP